MINIFMFTTSQKREATWHSPHPRHEENIPSISVYCGYKNDHNPISVIYTYISTKGKTTATIIPSI